MSDNTANLEVPSGSKTPYYQDELVTLYLGDCREILPEVSADALVTDPPYGVELKQKMVRNKTTGAHAVGATEVTYDDDPESIAKLIAESIPLALERCGGRGVVFPGTRMMFRYPEPKAVGAVWLPAGTGMGPWGFQNSQPIFYFGSCPYLANRLGDRPNGFQGSATADGVAGHPCPKPVQWMGWAINRVSLPGESILDPFAGSGTTLVAAKQNGRRAIGIEIDESYCEIAVKRLAQGVMFDVA